MDVGGTKPSESGIRVHVVVDVDADAETSKIQVGQCETKEAGNRSFCNVAALASSINCRGSNGGTAERPVTEGMRRTTKRDQSIQTTAMDSIVLYDSWEMGWY